MCQELELDPQHAAMEEDLRNADYDCFYLLREVAETQMTPVLRERCEYAVNRRSIIQNNILRFAGGLSMSPVPERAPL